MEINHSDYIAFERPQQVYEAYSQETWRENDWLSYCTGKGESSFCPRKVCKKWVLLCYREERRLPERSLRRRNWERAVERQSGGTLYLV